MCLLYRKSQKRIEVMKSYGDPLQLTQMNLQNDY